MTGKANNQLKSVATILCLSGAMVAVLGLIYLFFTPKAYEASVKIRLRNWARSDATNGVQNAVDLPTECRMARSDDVLDQAVRNLGLNELWGKRFNQGAPLKSEQTRALLKAKVDTHPVPRSGLIQISAASADPNEAAKIANEIARLYRDKRQAQRQTVNADRVGQFKQKWDEQGQRVRQAQDALAKLYLEITRNRTTNPAAIHEMVLARRMELEGQYIGLRDELDRLKVMKPEQLRRVLPTLETNANSVLTASLTQWSKARTDLVLAQSTYAANSPEVNDAVQVVNELDKTINQTITGIIAARETEVLSLKAALDAADEKLKRTSANLNEIAEQNAAYARAQQNVKDLRQERDALQEKMDEEESHDALMPAVVVPEIIDSAEPPLKPATPDGKIGASTVAAGSLAALVGLFLMFAGQKAKPAPRKL